MKRAIVLLFIITLSGGFISAQDFIIKTDDTEIQAKVIEITTDVIRYKEFDFQEGPTRTIQISDVSMIIYEGGRRETFQAIKDVVAEDLVSTGYKGDFFMISIGGGTSYGGVGLRLQFRAGKTVGFGMHGGMGYTTPVMTGSYSDEPYLRFATGIKFFPFRGLYLNYQIGIHDDPLPGILITGTSMIGADLAWGRTVGFGFNIGGGVTFLDNRSGTDRLIMPALDIAFAIRF